MVLIHKEAREKNTEGRKGAARSKDLGGQGGSKKGERERALLVITLHPPSPAVRAATPVHPPSRPAPLARCAVRALGCVRVHARPLPPCLRGGAGAGGPRCVAAALAATLRGGGPGRLLEVEKCLLSWGRCGGRGASAVASVTVERLPAPGGCCHVGGRCGASPVPLRAPPRRRPLRCVAKCAHRRRTAPGKKFQLRFQSKSLTAVQNRYQEQSCATRGGDRSADRGRAAPGPRP